MYGVGNPYLLNNKTNTNLAYKVGENNILRYYIIKIIFDPLWITNNYFITHKLNNNKSENIIV